jgi:hypothetical protein
MGLIEASGLSQRTFGQQIGLDETKLSTSMSGSRRFSSLDLARIAETCQVTASWLITGDATAIAVAERAMRADARSAAELAKRYCIPSADLASLGYGQPWRRGTPQITSS